jgi:hypothetical protein
MNDAPRGSFGTTLLLIILLIVVVIGGVWVYNKNHVVTVGEHVGEAIDAVPAKVSKAADEITDKDAIDKTGEALKDVGKSASSAVSKTGAAASKVVSDTSDDIKAASDNQKERNAEASRSRAAD